MIWILIELSVETKKIEYFCLSTKFLKISSRNILSKVDELDISTLFSIWVVIYTLWLWLILLQNLRRMLLMLHGCNIIYFPKLDKKCLFENPIGLLGLMNSIICIKEWCNLKLMNHSLWLINLTMLFRVSDIYF